MTRAELWGREHESYRDVAVRPVSPAVAVALTRGWWPKAYAHVDPNEDVAAAVVGRRATLLVVADGHNGTTGAEEAVRAVLATVGDDPPAPPVPDDDLLAWFRIASEVVAAAGRAVWSGHAATRTTLTLALLGDRVVQWGAVGDSVVLVVGPGGGVTLSRAEHEFLGTPRPAQRFDSVVQRAATPLPAEGWVILATDGFTAFAQPDPATAAAGAVAGERDAASAARALVAHAGEHGAGDNVAVAVARVVTTAEAATACEEAT